MKLPEACLPWLENMVNGFIALDPEFPRRLDALCDKTVRLEIAGMNLEVDVSVAHRRVVLRQSRPNEPDAVVRGTPLGLLNLLRAEDPGALVQEGMIELRGDVQLAREVKKIFDSLDIDWEEKVSRVIGDWPAHQFGIIIDRFGKWHRRSDESVQSSMGEYLQEELRLLPARIEIENFISEVDAIREALDRLEARVNLMQEKRNRP